MTLRRELSLFAGAVGVLAVHVLDDNFVQPQPGTSAADHLVSGLVPLALLALAGWAYPRLRGGRRGALALLLGLLGIAGGVEAMHYSRQLEASGDDFTGLLCLPAGVLLLGLGATTLWRTRRREGGWARRALRRTAFGVAGLLGFLFVALPVGGAYVQTHAARAVMPPPVLGAAHENVSVTTRDGLKLKGWYVPSRNGAAVIAFPGRKGPQAHARMLIRHGYGVLLLDRRGEGESEGDPNSWGWGGEKDVKAAIAFLQRRSDVEDGRIGGIGLSVGGEMMIETAAETDALKAVVSEGAGIRSTREAVSAPGAGKLLAPYFVMRDLALGVFANDAPPPNLEKLVAKISPRPLMLINSARGQGGEVELQPEFFRAARAPKQLWTIPDAGHTGGIRAHPQEYERRVVGFFDDALLER